MSSVIKTGKTIDDAVLLALKELGATRDQVEIEVMDEGNKGIFGLFGNKEARVKVTVKESLTGDIKAFLESIFEKLGVEAVAEVAKADETHVTAEIVGPNVGILIGRRGETLDALQYLTNLVINKKTDEFVRVTVDTENYRKKRDETLVNLANKLAARVVKYKRSVTLEPMNPYERRIIHETLQANDQISTYSVGDEPNRKVVISVKGQKGNRRKPAEKRQNNLSFANSEE